MVVVGSCDCVSPCSAVHAFMVGAYRERMDAVCGGAWSDQFSDSTHGCVYHNRHTDHSRPADPRQIAYSNILEVIQVVVLASSPS